MSAPEVSFSRSIPVRHEVDVFIAGGGPAGTAAAYGAAKAGASVFLAEGEICFGGVGTAGGINMLCVFSDRENFVADGFGREIYERLHKRGFASRSTPYGWRDVHFAPENLKLIYDELMDEAGVKYTFNTHVIGLECEGGWVKHVICYGKSGIFAVKAKAYVDATGDGDLCTWAGGEMVVGDAEGNRQPGTFVSFWSGIDWDKAEASGNGVWKQEGKLKQAIADGVFTQHDYGMPGILPYGKLSGAGNIGHLFGVDGTDERSLTENAVLGRKIAREYGEYFRKYLTGYEQMELVGMGSRVGIRETRRAMGDYVLNVDDYWNKAVFDDEIGRYCYGIDIHATSLTPKKKKEKEVSFGESWLKDGESYGIPYRCLTPKNLHNLFSSGRCVSVDREVLGSIRVMPGCYITGQASGTAAAMVAEKDVDMRSIDVKELQGNLKKIGAYLPNM
ncbi:MAG: FAD-dependent oxidoreductase [Planctomycetes bacterium]|nr:FAD-dependent oxidoreductase [Planctomycetota bacterium]